MHKLTNPGQSSTTTSKTSVNQPGQQQVAKPKAKPVPEAHSLAPPQVDQ
jgi:hypothetical protein